MFHKNKIILAVIAVFPTGDLIAENDVSQQAIRILESRCFGCHNDVDQKGDLSFETYESLQNAGLIEPGQPAASGLLTAVSPVDGVRPVMPKDAKPLSNDERTALRRWIVLGASWPKGYRLQQPSNDNFEWWSFQPLKKPAIPHFDQDSSEAKWVKTPVDAFVARKHRELGLAYAAEADRRTLVRRLYYDLTGLPPSPVAVQAFIHDDEPDAWDALVDGLLDSDHYGEHWTRHWLDVVKYADTCGYDKDKLRPNAWPYRDYVIESFNADKPYAQFVQEQIAGDVLFPGEDGIRALGFIAAGPWDFIGHAEVSEKKIDGQIARHLDRDDMVSNTLNTFCSVTIQCARCHNHKFDPFTQEHYYSLQSVFAAVDKADRPFDLRPETEKLRSSLMVRLNEADTTIEAHRKALRTAGGEELRNAKARVAEFKDRRKERLRPAASGYHSQIAATSNSVKWVEVDLGRPVKLKELQLRASSDDFAGVGPGFGFPVRFRIEVSLSPIDDQPPLQLGDFETAPVLNPRLTPLHIPADGVKARFIRVTATELAKRKDDYVFALAELQAIDFGENNMALNATVNAKDSIESRVRWRKSNLTDGLFPLAKNPEAVQRLAVAEQNLVQLEARLKTPEWTTRNTELQSTIDELKRQLEAIPAGKMVYAAATHFEKHSEFKPTEGKPRIIRILHRGNITQPLQEVSPGVIPRSAGDEWRLPLDDDHGEAARRAALADWLTDTGNPLIWRSVVNRIWQYHFGQAIVSTPNDFGRMGQLPTHPELLDWLAVEFRDSGQSFKHLHRLILSSAVWKQSSDHDPHNAAIDGSNRFFWQHSRRRLSAEELRDSILSVSGRLNPRMGGPGFYLFALEKTEHSPHYEYHKFDPADETSHRRSIYRFIVRSQPDPFMTTLDCADSSQSTPKRTETFTPLQALSLMNNRFILVMAQSFSERLLRESEDPATAVNLAFALCTGRTPKKSERQEMIIYAAEHGTPALCRLMFNLSEFTFID